MHQRIDWRRVGGRTRGKREGRRVGACAWTRTPLFEPHSPFLSACAHACSCVRVLTPFFAASRQARGPFECRDPNFSRRCRGRRDWQPGVSPGEFFWRGSITKRSGTIPCRWMLKRSPSTTQKSRRRPTRTRTRSDAPRRLKVPANLPSPRKDPESVLTHYVTRALSNETRCAGINRI